MYTLKEAADRYWSLIVYFSLSKHVQLPTLTHPLTWSHTPLQPCRLQQLFLSPLSSPWLRVHCPLMKISYIQTCLQVPLSKCRPCQEVWVPRWVPDAAPGAAVAVAQNPGRLCQCRCRSQCGSSLGRPCPWLSPRADSPVAMARLCQWTPRCKRCQGMAQLETTWTTSAILRFSRCMLFVGWRQPSNQLCLGTPTGTHCQCSSIALRPTLEEQWRSLVSLRCQESQKSLISQTCQPLSLLCRPFLRPGLAATLQSATLVGASTSVGTGTILRTFWFQTQG